jgi:DNA-binding transcriptional ArsR family regulator
VLSQDEAFGVLGNETRMEIVRALGGAEDTLSFTELRDRVGLRQGSHFNYHLSKLLGHFVRKTDDGYTLRQPGRRVVQAVLSGAVTSEPVIERSPISEWTCPYCGGATEIVYHDERVERYCTGCAGLYERGEERTTATDMRGESNLGALYLPPAGVAGRDPDEVLDAAFTWAYGEWLVAGNGVCPRCSATVEHSIEVCEDHATEVPICHQCGRRQAVNVRFKCTNCNFTLRSVLSMYLASTTELLAFTTARGIDPLSDPWDWGWEYEEEIISTDPFEGRFTFTVDEDRISVTVDNDLSVTEVAQM